MIEEIDRKSLKFALYARKSTESIDKQVQSIDNQLSAMKKLAKRDGLKIVKIYTESISGGKSGARPEFEKMMKDIESGKINAILAWKLDRISRNPLDSGRVHQKMNDGEIKMIITDGREYTADDDLIFDVESSMDARFRKDLMKNVRSGMVHKAEKGWLPCIPPVGYLNDRIEKVIIKDSETWDKVRTIFNKFLTGTYTVDELTKYANEELRLKTHKRKKSGGKPLTHNGIRSILMNPFYTGKFRYAGKIYNGNHPAMISNFEFEKVQELLEPSKHNTRPKGNDLKPFLFRGLVKCGECGYAIVSEEKIKKQKNGDIHRHIYCHCSGKCKTHKCNQRRIYIKESELIEQVKNELAKYTIDDNFFKIAIEALAEEEENRISCQNEQTKELQRELSSKMNELNNLRRMRYRGEITDQAWFLEESSSLENEISSIERSITRVNQAGRDWRSIANDVFMFARYAKEDFDSDDMERKRQVLKALGAEITVLGRTINITPMKYLVPIKKAVSETARVQETARTAKLQGSDEAIHSLISQWYTG